MGIRKNVDQMVVTMHICYEGQVYKLIEYKKMANIRLNGNDGICRVWAVFDDVGYAKVLVKGLGIGCWASGVGCDTILRVWCARKGGNLDSILVEIHRVTLCPTTNTTSADFTSNILYPIFEVIFPKPIPLSVR